MSPEENLLGNGQIQFTLSTPVAYLGWKLVPFYPSTSFLSLPTSEALEKEGEEKGKGKR